ncbi:hypothetical protein FKM82_012487 [Ascaphus truei]
MQVSFTVLGYEKVSAWTILLSQRILTDCRRCQRTKVPCKPVLMILTSSRKFSALLLPHSRGLAADSFSL